MLVRTEMSLDTMLPQLAGVGDADIRAKILYILNSSGDIFPDYHSPLATLVRLLNQPDSSIDQCVKVIKLDSVLASRVFRLANSAVYAGHSHDVSDAVLHIGLRSIRELVINEGVFTKFSKMGDAEEMKFFWFRNIFTARVTERIASHYFTTNGEEYLAGLVHDIGWPFLSEHFPKEFDRIVHSLRLDDLCEKRLMGFSHADIAGAICLKSHLPLRVANSVIYHHDPDLIDEKLIIPGHSAKFLGVILHVVDRLADCCGLPLFESRADTIDDLQLSAEWQWLESFGAGLDLVRIAEEEWMHSREMCEAYGVN